MNQKNTVNHRFKDRWTAVGFLTASFVFLFLMIFSRDFFDWAFARHQNVLSWYIRPLFLIPFCYFAYRRSWSGVLGTIFLLLTSMFWFPEPAVPGDQVQEFLVMEKEYLTSSWDLTKVLLGLTIPVFFIGLGAALWKRSLPFGLAILVLAAVGKTTWSLTAGGEAGRAVLVPAGIGLVLCLGLVYWGFKRLEKKGREGPGGRNQRAG